MWQPDWLASGILSGIVNSFAERTTYRYDPLNREQTKPMPNGSPLPTYTMRRAGEYLVPTRSNPPARPSRSTPAHTILSATACRWPNLTARSRPMAMTHPTNSPASKNRHERLLRHDTYNGTGQPVEPRGFGQCLELQLQPGQ